MAQTILKLLLSSSLLSLTVGLNPLYSVQAKTGTVHKPVSHARTLSSSEIVASLRAANVTDPGYSLSATQADGQLIVTTQKNPKFNDDDTKVQGILIAKTAFDLLPDSIQRTKVLFHDLKNETFSTVMINRTEVESYGRGLIDQKKLLGSLELEKKKLEGSATEENTTSSEATDFVVDGPFKAERSKEYSNIEFLKSKGADVSRLEAMFAAQESKAREGDKESVRISVKTIGGVISEQTNAFSSAQATANGKTVHMNPELANNTASGANFKSPHEMPLAKILVFLGHKGVAVDSQWQELTAERKLSGEEYTRRRAALVADVTNKVNSLSPPDQEELNNSLHFGGKRYRKADNSKWMTRGASQSPRGNSGQSR